MSRLKGADLGVAVPAGTLNYRGPWSSTASPGYAVNDMALRLGIPYVAMVSPGSIDPVGGSTSLGASTSVGAASYWSQQSAQAFTPTRTITVSAVTLTAGTGGGAMTSGTVSITPDFAQGAAIPAALASVATGALASGSSATYTFPTPVTLQAGVTYRLIVTDPNVLAKPVGTASGSITVGNCYTGSAGGAPNATTSSTFWTIFSLVGNPWQPLDPATQQMNFRGAYDSTQVYNPNDVVTSSGLLWLALGAAGVGQTPTASYGTVTTAAVGASIQAGYDTGITGTGSNGGTVAVQIMKFTTSQSITVNALACQVAGSTTAGVPFVVGIQTRAPNSWGDDSWVTQNGKQMFVSLPDTTPAGEAVAPLPGFFTLPPGTYWIVSRSTTGSGTGCPTRQVSTSGGTLKGAVSAVTDSGHIGTGGSNVNTGETTMGLNFYLSNTSTAVNPWTPIGAAVTGALNYRGQWVASPNPAYAANDVVLDVGALWQATIAIPAGAGYEPSLAPTYVPAGNIAGAATVAGASAAAVNSVAMPFTTTAAPGSVSGVQITFGSAPGATSIRVGIATAIGANDGAITWLGATPAAVVAPTAAGTFNYALPAPVALTGSTTYYVVVQVVAGGNSNVNWGAAGTVVSGNVASTGTLQRTSAIGGAWSTNTFNMPFALYNNALNYWQPLSPTQENVNIVNSGSAVTLPDVGVATMHRVLLNAATPAITLPPPGPGKSFTVELVQDATGGRVPTWATPTGAIRWPGGAAPTITGTANAIDVISFACIGGANWYGFVAGQAFA